MAKRSEPKDLNAIFRELETGTNDRATIIVAASLVEHVLQLAISAKLRKPSNSETAILFHYTNGIFNTFSDKIWAAYFLKIIDADVKRDLNLVKDIRNLAAHDMNPVSFGTPEIKKRCDKLKLSIVRRFPMQNDPRERFLETAFSLLATLYMQLR